MRAVNPRGLMSVLYRDRHYRVQRLLRIGYGSREMFVRSAEVYRAIAERLYHEAGQMRA